MTEQEVERELRQIERAVKQVEQKIAREHKTATTFVAVDRVIMLGSYCVGRMKSRNYAIRTANALNKYVPNERGV